ncbi:MAG TPA: response regulator [Solirubrobacteraceae bacterium]|nr:response regulator [Solirubrobacteraceae bacterium]
MNVLIADDDASTRLLVSTAVERLGHTTVVADDGSEAWRLYQEEQPEVVITDWQMPGMDGTALVKAIRSHDVSRYAYVMVLTGAADEDSARATMEAGSDDLLHKPLDFAQLERKLIAAGRVTELHARLHDNARHDALTGLSNRLRLAEDLELLCGRVERYGHAYCVALFDIDDFKGVNDASGHVAGDSILRAVAQALERQIRTGDAVYRYGGEEFLVLLPEQTIDSALLAAERLRAAVEALALPHPGGGVVTVSAGVAGTAERGCRPDELFKLADEALYRAKDRGRNRVEVQSGAVTQEEAPVRLLIADDDPATRLFLSALMGRADGIELVGEAEDAHQAIDLAARRRPDVVLLDFDMPGGGGVAAAMGIREANPTTRIVALSADDTQGAQYDMSRAGAVGYVVKGAPDDEIVRTIRSSAKW